MKYTELFNFVSKHITFALGDMPWTNLAMSLNWRNYWISVELYFEVIFHKNYYITLLNIRCKNDWKIDFLKEFIKFNTLFGSHEMKKKKGKNKRGGNRTEKNVTIFYIILFGSYCLPLFHYDLEINKIKTLQN